MSGQNTSGPLGGRWFQLLIGIVCMLESWTGEVVKPELLPLTYWLGTKTQLEPLKYKIWKVNPVCAGLLPENVS